MEKVLALKDKNSKLWRDKPDSYWFMRLLEEVGELALSLRGRHEHSPETELRQITSICLNWLEYREKKKGGD